MVGGAGGSSFRDWGLQSMLPGSDYLAQAREFLLHTGTPTSERLIAAWPLFWKAMFHEPDWPTPLRNRAGQLVSRLLAQGEAAASVRAMADAERQKLLEELSSFIGDFMRHGAAMDQMEIQIQPLERKPDTVQGN